MLRFWTLIVLLLGAWLPWGQTASAQFVDVQPRTQFVNVSSTSSFSVRWLSTVGQFEVDPDSAFFCLDYGGFGIGCREILGRLPSRLDRAPSGLVTSFQEVVTVPTSIVNRAMNLARARPENALIFFVRRLIPADGTINLGAGPGQPTFVQVNLRLTGSSAGKSLAFSKVKIFAREPGRNEVRFPTVTAENRDTGEICVEIEYTGAGRVTGFWQVWTRNDPPLREIDRLPEGSVLENERPNQRRFYQAMRIRENFGPSGRIKLTLPYSKLPLNDPGVILVYPYFEISRDRRSQAALANFPGGRRVLDSGPTGPVMPVLPVRVGVPDRGAETLVVDARFQQFESAAGTPGAMGVVWTAVKDKPLVIEITLEDENTGRVHRLIAPIEAGRAVFPEGWIDPDRMTGPGLPAGYSVSIAVLGRDKRPYPGAEASTLDGGAAN